MKTINTFERRVTHACGCVITYTNRETARLANPNHLCPWCKPERRDLDLTPAQRMIQDAMNAGDAR